MRGRHLLAHPFEQVVERLRRIVAEHVAELVHEFFEARIFAGDLLHQHVVQRLQHVLHALDVAGRHLFDHTFDVVEERLRHGAAQLVQQFEEFALRVGVDELVLFERLDLPGSVRRQLVERFLRALRDPLHQIVGEIRFLRRSLAASFLFSHSSMRSRSIASISSSCFLMSFITLERS